MGHSSPVGKVLVAQNHWHHQPSLLPVYHMSSTASAIYLQFGHASCKQDGLLESWDLLSRRAAGELQQCPLQVHIQSFIGLCSWFLKEVMVNLVHHALYVCGAVLNGRALCMQDTPEGPSCYSLGC